MTQLPPRLLQDPALQSVLDAIETDGHRVWLVGGAVRNALLDMPVEDVDLATDALPETVVDLARAAGLKPVPTGIDHGTITVVAQGRGFEVTTLRHDVETDGRRAVVAFADDLAQDARRRDFTMNALYADRSGTVIDLVGGLEDLRAGRLRFVGDPAQRLAEDYLRILRFFRFLAWYGRDADPDAVAACRDGRDGLEGISRERIGQELRKLLMAPDPVPAVRLMQDSGVLDKVLPEATPERLYALQSPAPWLARLAALSQADLSDTLRLSRSDARDHRILVTALTESWSFNRIAYRLGGDLAQGAAALVQTGPSGLRDGWPDAQAAACPLPITASDLQPRLQGAALGRALKAAEDAWIDAGFALPPPALIDIALLAGETP
ncbi:CCA tRNA nucleotidyltransferase [Paracoccus benzoatiresistens]|uniref:CCA tRNA nucleotidyltransferase n=1 Tax=Paracoccus benzoatiresistens TaxID=2997341 RepID=A0ABT4J6Z3_9RHOB|nr:CCA tRNA nucleotidyltransferase [Paracoccus sp. EF6]MCZ0962895.1 CCA tRNA nucleotidyltransferase [Paracoccus sp. EF6]